MEMKGILLMDGHAVIRQAFASAFDREPDLEVVGEAGAVADLYSVEGLDEIDFAFIDWDLSDGEVTDLVGKLREINPCLWLVEMIPEFDLGMCLRAWEAGVDEVVSRSDALKTIVATIKHGMSRRGVPPTVV